MRGVTAGLSYSNNSNVRDEASVGGGAPDQNWEAGKSNWQLYDIVYPPSQLPGFVAVLRN